VSVWVFNKSEDLKDVPDKAHRERIMDILRREIKALQSMRVRVCDLYSDQALPICKLVLHAYCVSAHTGLTRYKTVFYSNHPAQLLPLIACALTVCYCLAHNFTQH
jgi:hypothetical protein